MNITDRILWKLSKLVNVLNYSINVKTNYWYCFDPNIIDFNIGLSKNILNVIWIYVKVHTRLNLLGLHKGFILYYVFLPNISWILNPSLLSSHKKNLLCDNPIGFLSKSDNDRQVMNYSDRNPIKFWSKHIDCHAKACRKRLSKDGGVASWLNLSLLTSLMAMHSDPKEPVCLLFAIYSITDSLFRLLRFHMKWTAMTQPFLESSTIIHIYSLNYSMYNSSIYPWRDFGLLLQFCWVSNLVVIATYCIALIY